MTTRIEIEILVVIILLFVFIAWSIFAWVSKLIARRRYKPENDKSRLGEEKRRSNKGFTRFDKGTGEEDSSLSGFDKPSGSSLFQTTTTSNDGEKQHSFGEDSGSIGKLRRRRRRFVRRRK